MGAEPSPTTRWHPRRLCLVGAVVGLAALGLIECGGLRRRVSSVHQVVPGSTLAHPATVVVERHADREYHYGLLFQVGRSHERLRLAWYSVLDTHLCDRGPIRRWQGRPQSSDGESLELVLFLPRSWLILHGFLPLRAGFDRHHPYRLHDQELLLRSFWLEAFGDSPPKPASPTRSTRANPSI